MPEYTKMTVAQLKAELGKRELEKTGTKSDLVSRLTKNDEGTEVQEDVKLEDNGTEEAHEELTEEAPEEEEEEELAIEAEEAEESMEVDEEGTEAAAAAEDELEEELAIAEEEAEQDAEQEELNAEDLVVKEQVGETDGDGDVKFDDEDQKNDDTEDGDADKSENKSKDDDDKSDKKTKKGPKKWVAIMENEKTAKVLDELRKINKLESLKSRSREIFQAHETHKVRMFPVVPDDLSDPMIIQALKLSTSSMVRFSSTDPSSERKGMLEITFPKRSVLDEHYPKLSLYKESIQVIIDKKENEWRDQYKQAVEIPEHAGDLEKLRLFAPSLPQSVEEADLWDYFPNAREILLIEAKPRKHAYITFLSEESMIESVEALNVRGPQKDDFKFCRLLRLAEIVKYLPRRDFKNNRTARNGPHDSPRTPRAGPRTPRAGFVSNFGSGRKPMNASRGGKVTPRQSDTGMRTSRDIQRRRETIPRRRDDRRDRGTSYWGAPRQRTAGLETSFSQLQPAPMVNPQAGLQVLDTLLTTLGQMGNQQSMAGGSGGGMGRQQDRRMMSPRGGDTRSRQDMGQKRAHSPPSGRGNNNRRKRPRSTRGGYDGRRGSYGQGNYQGGSQGYSRGSDYGRQSGGQGGDRLYNTMDAVNKIQRLRDTIGQGQRQNQYSGSGYRQDSYY